MSWLIFYLVIGAIWSSICEIAMPEGLDELDSNAFKRWAIGALLWPLEIFFLVTEWTKGD